jgi:hypothetical protein
VQRRQFCPFLYFKRIIITITSSFYGNMLAMRRKAISSASLLSLVLSMILSLSAISSGIGIAKADSVIATIPLSTSVAFPFGVAFDSANGRYM